MRKLTFLILAGLSTKAVARHAYKSLSYVEDRLGPMLDDPMTSAMGAPVEDFAEHWGREALSLQDRCLRELQKRGVYPRLQEMLVDALTSHI